MNFDLWYPVKTDKAFQLISFLIQENTIPDIEFNSELTKVRRIDLSQYDSHFVKNFKIKIFEERLSLGI